ncbi:hypothetical protein SCHPADRAFT_943117 [Schizopora paradoxa]|uniref:Uncharacterized protein n=1 Tax=Schizopora paradoxa TaxID=27342 RepID=A0A0H2RE70_9AGAM|nr:hypothetical protein SCHPADRAFT_943117 [Schizopora paradoxa]
MPRPHKQRINSASSFPNTVILHAENGKRARFTIAEDMSSTDQKSIVDDDESCWSFYSMDSTNVTMSDLVGPGRILDRTLRKAGRFLERKIALISYERRSSKESSYPALERIERCVLHDDYLADLLSLASSRDQNCQLKALRDIVHCKVVDFSLGCGSKSREASAEQNLFLESCVLSWAKLALGRDCSEEWLRYFRLAALCLTGQNLHERFVGKASKDRLVECLNLCDSDNACEFGVGARMLAKYFEWSLRPKDLYTAVLSLANSASFLQTEMALGPLCLDVDAVDELAGEIVSFWVYDPFLSNISITPGVMECLLTITELVKKWKDVFKSAYTRIFINVAFGRSESMRRRMKVSSWSLQEKEDLQARLCTVFGEDSRKYIDHAGSFTLAYMVYTTYHFLLR